MAFVIKIAKTLRNHWKKSTVLFLGSSYGLYYLHERYQEDLLRAEYCKIASAYGLQPIKSIEKPKKITVYLNPAARKGKAKKLFDKNAAPLLHLAGYNVEVIQTSYDGHLKDLIGSLEDTDALVAVGGDGTLGELITGLLRREDGDVVCQKWPIGFIPAGVTNSLARILYSDVKDEVRWMCNATMAVIRGLTTHIDVMAIKDAEDRTVYAVSHLRSGPLDDAAEKNTKFWYFGWLKHRAAFLFYPLLKEWPGVVKAKLSYTGPVDVPVQPEPEVPPGWLTQMWNMLFGPPKVEEEEPEEVIEEWIDRDLSTTELLIQTNQGQLTSEGKKSLSLKYGPTTVSRIDFIREGWRRLNVSAASEPSEHFQHERIHVGNIKIDPVLKKSLLETPGETGWFTVDSERLEAGPVDITFLPNKLYFFKESQEDMPPTNTG